MKLSLNDEVELPDPSMQDAIWTPAFGNLEANDGNGNCLWYSLAAALSHHSGKIRSHRQVCALTIAYMSRFEADFALLGMELALRVNRLQAILPSISNLWKKFALAPEH